MPDALDIGVVVRAIAVVRVVVVVVGLCIGVVVMPGAALVEIIPVEVVAGFGGVPRAPAGEAPGLPMRLCKSDV